MFECVPPGGPTDAQIMSDPPLDPRWYVCVLGYEGLVPLVGPCDDVAAAAAIWERLTVAGQQPGGWLLPSGEAVDGDLVLGAASRLSSPFVGLGKPPEEALNA